MKYRGWIVFSGFLWMMVGMGLLYKGLHLISEATKVSDSLSFRFQGVFGSQAQVGTMILAFALLVGFLKGRFVLSKTVNRVVARIFALSLPIRASKVYAPSYWILIGFMVGLGMLFRFLPIPIDMRGFIDVAIGSALIQGAMLYFRASRLERITNKNSR